MIQQITSNQNKLYKQWKKLSQKSERDKTALFLAEGKRLVDDAVASGWVTELVVVQGNPVPEADVPVYVVRQQLFAGLAQTESPQGILAVCAKPPAAPLQGDRLLVCDGVADPGNMGTLIRTAECSGMDGVVILPGCVDVYSPKVVRATMGSLFRLPLYFMDATALANQPHQLVITTLEGRENLYQATFSHQVMIVVGNEAKGVSPQLAAMADKAVTIPMEGGAESLNAAMAGGIVMYELLRRRKAVDR